MKVWFWRVRFLSLTGWVTTLLMRLLTLVGEGSVLLLSMLVVISLEFVVDGILLFLIFIGSLLPFLGPLFIMMDMKALHLILLFGLLVLYQRGDGWFMLCVTLACCLGHLQFGLVNGLLVLLLILVPRKLLSGPTLLVFWSTGLPF